VKAWGPERQPTRMSGAARHARRLRAPTSREDPTTIAIAHVPAHRGRLVSRSRRSSTEVTLPDLLPSSPQLRCHDPSAADRLPLLDPLGDDDRSVFVVEQPPSRRTIEYHARRRRASEPTTYRLAVPYVIFVVSTIGEQIEDCPTYFRTQPIASLDATFSSPCEHERRWDRLSRIGPGERCERWRASRRPHRCVLGEPLQPGTSAGTRCPSAAGFGLGRLGPARSARRPCPCNTTLLADPPPVAAQMAGWRSPICRPGHPCRRSLRRPSPDAGTAGDREGETDAIAS